MEIVVLVPVLASVTTPGLGCELSVVGIVVRLSRNWRVIRGYVAGGEDLLWLLVSRVHVQVVFIVVLGSVVHQGSGVGVVQVHKSGILKGLQRSRKDG